MAKKTKAKRKASKKAKPSTAKRTKMASQRFWLLFSKKLVANPIIYDLGHKFDVVTNIRQASVHDEVGLVSLEITGAHAEIGKSVKWLEKAGVKVEPVEINVIAG